MLPNNNALRLLETRDPLLFEGPKEYDPLVSYERGGVGISNAGKGLDQQTWVLKYKDGDFILSDEFSYEQVLKSVDESKIEVSKVSLTFDQNMKPVWGFSYKVKQPIDGAFLFSNMYWFDSVQGDYIETVYKNTFDIQLKLDDMRVSANTYNDVILMYQNKERVLNIRYQRDRYAVEYPLIRLPEHAVLGKTGMTRTYRFQIEIRATDPVKHTDTQFILGTL